MVYYWQNLPMYSAFSLNILLPFWLNGTLSNPQNTTSFQPPPVVAVSFPAFLILMCLMAISRIFSFFLTLKLQLLWRPCHQNKPATTSSSYRHLPFSGNILVPGSWSSFPPPFLHYFLSPSHSFFHSTNIFEHLLCARYCSKHFTLRI